MSAPVPGITTNARVVDVIDADTVTVEVTRRFDVRLMELDSPKGYIYDGPEKNTRLGKYAKAYLEDRILGQDVVVCLPSNDPSELMDMNSFNRLLGAIWHRGQLLTEQMKEIGYGRTVKQSKRKTTPWPGEDNEESDNRSVADSD